MLSLTLSLDKNLVASGIPFQQLKIDRSDSFNHIGGYPHSNAHDGNYNTWYSIQDGSMAGNFLKLYLGRAFSITLVRVTSQKGTEDRLANTEGRVFSTGKIEIEVASCGKITGISPIN